jgi:hypothetical protein
MFEDWEKSIRLMQKVSMYMYVNFDPTFA